VQLPRAKVSVRTVRAWGERKAVGGAAAQATPVRPVLAWTGSSLGFMLVQVRGLFLEVVVLVVCLESLQEVSLLCILPLELSRGWEESWLREGEEGWSTGFLSWFWSSSRQRGLVPSWWLPWWCSWR
jgi:hypothetical protein